MPNPRAGRTVWMVMIWTLKGIKIHPPCIQISQHGASLLRCYVASDVLANFRLRKSNAISNNSRTYASASANFLESCQTSNSVQANRIKEVPEFLLHLCKRSTIKHGASKVYVEYLRYPEDGLFIFNLIRAGYRLELMVDQNQGRLPLMLMRSKSSMLRVK